MNLKELSKFIKIGKAEKILSGIFLFLLLFPFPTGGDRFFWKYFFDAGHPGLFFLCTIFIFRIYLPEENKSKRRVIIECSVFSFLIAATIELIQPILGRSASIEDLALGALGIMPAGMLISPIPILKILAVFLLFLVQSIAFAPATKAMHAIKWRKENFPILANFEEETQLYLIRGTFSPAKTKNRRFIKTYQPYYSEYLIRYEGGDKDWSAFKFFNTEIYNPTNIDTEIHIRIDDDKDCEDYDSRFNKTIQLLPGWNKVSIPIEQIKDGPENRELNLNKIRYIYFFTLENANWFGLDNFELTN